MAGTCLAELKCVAGSPTPSIICNIGKDKAGTPADFGTSPCACIRRQAMPPTP
jgi:hypothetical protein